ncbi:MAG: hypothetical protein EPO36_06715 [Chloroflexota bacterium]|nr:MAG: hypothetical protein EPO36_06715 [Chloroflexota bacterium]
MVERDALSVRRARRRVGARVGAWLAAALLVTGCGAILESPPEPTPADFPGIAGELASRGLDLGDIASGDAGCDDSTLIPTAIGFDASGLGQAEPIRLRVYIFRNGDAYDRRRPDVDACVAAWATDPGTVEMIDARPFVLAGQGPWPAEFKDAVREAMAAAAGAGG